MKACQQLDFEFLIFRTVIECISTINHPGFGHFFLLLALGKKSTYQYFLLCGDTFPLPTTPMVVIKRPCAMNSALFIFFLL